jgi:hypothetical protein
MRNPHPLPYLRHGKGKHVTKRGRPSKPGQRHPCGKRTKQQLALDALDNAKENRKVVTEARMRIFGVSYELAGTNAMGSPLQRLQHWNYITRDQMDAGHNFAEVMREYLSTGKLNRGTPSKANFVPGQPDNGEGPAVRGEARARAYMEALAEIDRADPFSAPTATSVVWRVCINEEDAHGEHEIGALRVGLNAIHRVMYGRKAA